MEINVINKDLFSMATTNAFMLTTLILCSTMAFTWLEYHPQLICLYLQ